MVSSLDPEQKKDISGKTGKMQNNVHSLVTSVFPTLISYFVKYTMVLKSVNSRI